MQALAGLIIGIKAAISTHGPSSFIGLILLSVIMAVICALLLFCITFACSIFIFTVGSLVRNPESKRKLNQVFTDNKFTQAFEE
jgi:uncharacterized membrane protein